MTSEFVTTVTPYFSSKYSFFKMTQIFRLWIFSILVTMALVYFRSRLFLVLPKIELYSILVSFPLLNHYSLCNRSFTYLLTTDSLLWLPWSSFHYHEEPKEKPLRERPIQMMNCFVLWEEKFCSVNFIDRQFRYLRIEMKENIVFKTQLAESNKHKFV